MTLEELRDWLPGFVAGTLDEAERAAVERELAARGTEGARELRAAAAVLAEIGQGVPQLAPPERLKAQIIAAAKPAPPARRLSSWHKLALAAGLGALVGGGVVALLGRGGSELERPAAETAQAPVVVESEAPAAAPAISGEALALLRDGEAYGLALGGSEEHEELWATVFWTPAARGCYFRAAGLPQVPGGASYTLWAENLGGQRERVGQGVAQSGELAFSAALPFAPEDIRRIELTTSDEPYVPLLSRAVFYRRN